jgi:hypothetical protein
MQTLFETVVGSHIWKMNHEGSDLDLFRCYISDTKDILLGKVPKNTFEQPTSIVDLQVSEIGAVISQLMHCNFNYLIAIHSPIVMFDNGNVLAKLRELSFKSLSKEAYNSIFGMCTQNYKKYIETGKDISEKRCNAIARTAKFGYNLLVNKKIVFEGVSGFTSEKLSTAIESLPFAKDNSTLPEKCPAEVKEEFEELLIKLRISDLNGK